MRLLVHHQKNPPPITASRITPTIVIRTIQRTARRTTRMISAKRTTPQIIKIVVKSMILVFEYDYLTLDRQLSGFRW